MLTFFSDTDCDITPKECAEYGIKLISMPYTVGDKEYHLTEEYASQTLVKDGVIYDKTKDKYYYNASLYLHHYTQDEILEGTYTNGDVTLKNGTGKYFGKNVWFLWDKDTGKVTRWRKGGTKPLTAFPSPRADEWFFE